MLLLLVLVLTCAAWPGQLAARRPEGKFTVGKPPEQLKLDPFYEKYTDAEGIPVIASRKVPDEALVMAAELVSHMLARRPDLRKALAERKVRIAVMAKSE